MRLFIIPLTPLMPRIYLPPSLKDGKGIKRIGLLYKGWSS